MTDFVILGHPRSGSTLLLNALREHPGLLVYGEVFNDEPEARRDGYGGTDEVYETGADGASFLAHTIFRDRCDPEVLAVGFKLLYSQSHGHGMRSAWDYLVDRTELRVIHLTRDSLLDAYVSLAEAEASGRWHVELHEAVASGAPLHIDPEACLEFLDGVHASREWARRAFRAHEVFELSYEQLTAEFGATLHDVQAFLGLPPVPLPALLRKQGLRPLAARVSNLDEIVDMLRRTIHAP